MNFRVAESLDLASFCSHATLNFPHVSPAPISRTSLTSEIYGIWKVVKASCLYALPARGLLGVCVCLAQK